jgi:hypothetical protein
MLFDLQSRGRRSAVKVIYLGLAVLMGGGLILFGIGTGTGGGGLFDVFSGRSSSTSSQISSAEKTAAREIRLHPKDPRGWADLARARYQTAGLGGNYDAGTQSFTTDGRRELAKAATAWQQYLTLESHPDATLARMMATTYSQDGIDQPANAAAAMEIVTAAQPSYAAYATLASYAYLANEMRKGDLAAGKAVQLAPSAQQRLVRTRLADFRRQVIQQQVQGATRQGAPGGTKSAPQGGSPSGVG